MDVIIKAEFDLISYFAAVSTVIGAFFLVRSILESGAKEIAAMSGTYVGSNPHLESALVKQKADSLVGFVITLVGGVLWGATVFCAANVDLNFRNILVVGAMSLLIILISFYLAKKASAVLRLKTRIISFCHHVASYLRGDAKSFDAKKLIEDAKRLGLKDLIDDQKDPHDNLAEILRRGGANPGAEHIAEIKSKKNIN